MGSRGLPVEPNSFLVTNLAKDQAPASCSSFFVGEPRAAWANESLLMKQVGQPPHQLARLMAALGGKSGARC